MSTAMWLLLLVAACVSAQSSPKIEGYKPHGDKDETRIPKTSFTCRGKIDGFYADTETGCRVFRYCQTYTFPDGEMKRKKWGFFCPPTTIFRQELLNCGLPHPSFRCADSEKYYYVNEELHRPPRPTSERPPLIPRPTSERPPLIPRPTSERPPLVSRPTLIPRPTTERENFDGQFPLLPPLRPSIPKPPRPVGSFLLPPEDFKDIPSAYHLQTSAFSSFQPNVVFQKLADMAAVRSGLLGTSRLALTPADTVQLLGKSFLIGTTKESTLPELKTRTKEFLQGKELKKEETFKPDVDGLKKDLKFDEEIEPVKFSQKFNEEKRLDEKKFDSKLKEERIEQLEKVSLPKFTATDLGIFQRYIDALNEENLNIFKNTFRLEDKEFPKSGGELETSKPEIRVLKKTGISEVETKSKLETIKRLREEMITRKDEGIPKGLLSFTDSKLKSGPIKMNRDRVPEFESEELRGDRKKSKEDERTFEFDLRRYNIDELSEKDKKPEFKSVEKTARPEIKVTDLGKPILSQFNSPLPHLIEPKLSLPVPVTVAKPYFLPEIRTPLIPVSFEHRLHTIGFENIEPTLFIGGPSAFNSELIGSTFIKSRKDASLKLEEHKKLSDYERLGSEDFKPLTKSRKDEPVKPEVSRKVPNYDEVPDGLKDRFFSPDFLSSFKNTDRSENKENIDLKSLTKSRKPLFSEDFEELPKFDTKPDAFKDGFFSPDFLSSFETFDRLENKENIDLKSLTKSRKPLFSEDFEELPKFDTKPDAFKDGFFSPDFLSSPENFNRRLGLEDKKTVELRTRFESPENVRTARPEDGFKLTRPETFGFGGSSERFRTDLLGKDYKPETFDRKSENRVKSAPEGRSLLEDEPVGPR